MRLVTQARCPRCGKELGGTQCACGYDSALDEPPIVDEAPWAIRFAGWVLGAFLIAAAPLVIMHLLAGFGFDKAAHGVEIAYFNAPAIVLSSAGIHDASPVSVFPNGPYLDAFRTGKHETIETWVCLLFWAILFLAGYLFWRALQKRWHSQPRRTRPPVDEMHLNWESNAARTARKENQYIVIFAVVGFALFILHVAAVLMFRYFMIGY